MTKPGHNSRAKAGPVNAERLKSFIERIEKLEEERKAIGGDVKDVYAEAKGVGYDVATMRKIVALRAKDSADIAEQETLLDVYKHALGMETSGPVTVVRTDPSEEELEALAGRIVAEVDRCMDLVGDGNQLPTIRAIQDAIGCSTGKASKLRGMVQERISRAGAVQREMKSPHDADGVVTETQDAALQGLPSPTAPQTEALDTPAVMSEGAATPADTPVPDGGVGTGTHSDEAPAPRSVGAVAAEPRVAPTPFMGDDPGAPPPFLIRAQAGRGA